MHDEGGSSIPKGSAGGPVHGGGGDLRFSLLGPVRAWHGGKALPPGSPQQRAVLAVLLLREGRTATVSELIDALWGEDPPLQARATIRTYASRLRKLLTPDALVSEAGGYALRVGRSGVDLAVAEGAAAEAERLRAAGEPHRARSLLDTALNLWDGEALAGLPGPYADHERARLGEWRLRLLETRLELDLETGRHAEAVSGLTALTAAHPLRERLRELLMLALYRAGRQAEALAVYADTRRLLAEELGVDPRAELSQLQQRILRADGELDRPGEGTTAPAPPGFGPPAQLPPSVADFTGRSDEVRGLVELLATAGGAVSPVAALAGIGGVGKTTLAVHAARLSRPHFPDGQLYADLQGAGSRPAEPATVLGAFLRTLGAPESTIPDSLEQRSALYRTLLAHRRILVLLDNARDTAQVRPLLPGAEGCAALITSRARLVGLENARLVDVEVMSPEESLQLFTRVVGEERVTVDRESALDVVTACGFLPLATRIAAARLAARSGWSVSVLSTKLADKRRLLDELHAGDLAVKATFELGYAQLEPAQARAFRLVALADGPDISLPAAAALLGLAPQDAEDLLEALIDTSLLWSSVPGRYGYHDLVRLYARACAERDERQAATLAARSRLLDFYLATAARAYAVERAGDRLPEHLEATAHEGLPFADRREAVDWLHTEAQCVLACVGQSTADGLLKRAVDLLWAAKNLAEWGAHSAQYATAARIAWDAARAAGDTRALGRAHTALTTVELMAGRYGEAGEHARRAALLGAEAGDIALVYAAGNDRGIIALTQHRHAESERFLRQAVEDARTYGNEPGQATSLCNLSHVYLTMDRVDEAIELARKGVDMLSAHGLTLRTANARYTLGNALTRAGRHAEALEEQLSALHGFAVNRQRLWEGTTHFRIAQTHLGAGRPAAAARHAEQALAIGCIGGDRIRAGVLLTLGRALHPLGQEDRARACWGEALALHRASEAPGGQEVLELTALLGIGNGADAGVTDAGR
ncbi:AfsR/SARP family transcriptional regulator [Streptomyces amakusaensis]|uniref:BTAD domain-containing putative transcriptional regulator n=1 Tax=Streptomyces amakusaensis TaxID=67271 RepID=A0ABW0ATH3_9ACTN